MGADGFGYTSTVRDDGTVKVSFKGNGRNTVPQARRYALCRAGEVIVERGLPFMAVVDEDGEDKFSGTYENCSKNYYTGQTSCYEYSVHRPAVSLVVRGIATPGETKGAAIDAVAAARECGLGKP